MPAAKSPDALKSLCDDMNGRLIDLLTSSPTPPSIPSPSSPQILLITLPRDGILLVELASQLVTIWFSSLLSDTIRDIIAPSASIILPTYYLICRFVPCIGPFDPSDHSCLDEIESRHNLSKGAITSANWVRDPEQRKPEQRVANLRITCSSADAANMLLTQEVLIGDRAVIVAKDKKDPLRCNNCQDFGHIKISCKGGMRCSYCASAFHLAATCPHKGFSAGYKCANCSGEHASFDHHCPRFLQLCKELDNHLPENCLPYFPSSESWTWEAPLSTTSHSLQ